MNKKLNKKGFTIVELVIVVAVIAILAVVMIPTFTGVVANSKNAAALSNAKAAYEEYVLAKGGEVDVDDFVFVDGDRYVAIKDGNVVDIEGKTEADALGVFKVEDDAATTDVNEAVEYKLGAETDVDGLFAIEKK